MPISKVLSGGIGLILGCAIGFAIEIAMLGAVNFLFGYHFAPIGAGWILLPLGLGISLTKALDHVDGMTVLRKSVGGARPLQAYATLCATWFLGILGWLVIAEPYGHYRLQDSDWIFLIKLSLLPPVLLFMAFGFYAFMGGRETAPR